MSGAINVNVVKFPDRDNYMLRFTDPLSGKRKHQNSGTSNKKEAERAAARWEDELKTGKYKSTENLTWEEFRDLFEDRYLKRKSQAYWSSFQAAFNNLESLTGVRMLRDVHGVLSDYIHQLQELEKSPNTIQSYMKHLRVALYWAAEENYLSEKTAVKVPKGTDDQMKGRPLEPAEFALMLAAVDEVIPEHASHWKQFLTGLWYSGLRRSEAIILSWDKDAPFSIDQSGLFWRFRIRAEAQKSRKSEFCVMPPDLTEWLYTTFPATERSGPVFQPVGFKGSPLTGNEVGRMVSVIGKRAGIETDPENGKFATCHDLRRSFGNRWSSELMPADLKKIMRHKSIETTMKYYVGHGTDELSARLHAKFAKTSVEVTKKVTN